MASAQLRAAAAARSGGSVLDRLFAGGRVLADGAMGTMLASRGVPIDRCYDELNLSKPGVIASVHQEYLAAGAQIIATNTFGGNGFRLEPHGLRDRVHSINLAGVRLAQKCVTMQATEAYVAGAVGPLGVQPGEVSPDEARAAFAEQIRALSEGGPGVGADLLILETMISLVEVSEAIRAAREVAPGLRIVAMMTVDDGGNCLDGASAETAAIRLTDLGADAVGCNCSTGPASVLSAIERMRGVTSLPLAAMPSAGLPRKVHRRNVYPVSTDEIAGFARRAIQAGAGLIGGCCGTTPGHTRAMQRALGGPRST
jgi:methionine synthase / methylenetetrahydrofolate reductase(NADPH)